MQALRLLAFVGAVGTVVMPAALAFTPTVAAAESQQPTKQQVKTAVKAAHPTIGQLRKLKKLEPNIDNMTPAELQQALGQIFSPQQLAAIRQSLTAQGISVPGH